MMGAPTKPSRVACALGMVLVSSDAAKPTAQTKPLRMVFASDMVQRPSAALMKGARTRLSRQGFASGMVPVTTTSPALWKGAPT